MIWIIYGIWFVTVSLIPLATTMIVYFRFKRYLWVVPVSGVLFSGILVLRDVLRYMPPESLLIRYISYFRSHVSVSFFVFYLPIAILALIYPLVFYIAGKVPDLICKYKK